MRDDLPHAMRETARRLEPDVPRLTAGGVSRGTRMRRLERVVQVLGSVVAVVVVFASVVLFGQQRGARAGGSGGGEANQPAASLGTAPLTTPAATASTNPSLAPSTVPTPATSSVPPTSAMPPTSSVTPTGGSRFSNADLISALEKGLGATGVTGSSYTAQTSASGPDPTVVDMSTIVVDARLSLGNEVGFLSVLLAGPEGGAPRPGTPQHLRDGSLVYISKAPGSSDGVHTDRVTLQVTLIRTDGSMLYATETNSATEKSAAAPGAPLPLSPNQVTELLDSPVWDDAVAAANGLS